MFSKDTYISRRKRLSELVGSGIIVLLGNNDSPCNYPANAYKFRQDSSFLYYFGQKREGLVGVIDIDNQKEYLFGDDIDIDDIIWFGYVPSVSDLGQEVGVAHSGSMKDFCHFPTLPRRPQNSAERPLRHPSLQAEGVGQREANQVGGEDARRENS